MQLYGLDPTPALAQAVAARLGQALSSHEDRGFDDGEHKRRPLTDPRGQDCYVIDSLHGGPVDSPDDKLCRLLMFIATLHEHGAARVTAVVPYLAYARKDRQTKPFDPVSLRHVAQLFEAVATAQLMVLEAHNVAAFQNAFRIPTLHLSAHPIFSALALTLAAAAPLVVASPDPGGVKRAQLWREDLAQSAGQAVGFALLDKRRSAGVLSTERLVAGDVEGATVMLLDDLIASGETMARAATALCQHGARQVWAFAAHGLFTGAAAATLNTSDLAGVVVTDSVPAFRLPTAGLSHGKLRVHTVSTLLAQAIMASRDAALR